MNGFFAFIIFQKLEKKTTTQKECKTIYYGVHSYMGGCPTTTTGFFLGGYPYHHHHGFGSGAGVPGSPLLTTTIFNDFSIDSRSRKNDTKTRTKFRYIWDKCLEFSQS